MKKINLNDKELEILQDSLTDYIDFKNPTDMDRDINGFYELDKNGNKNYLTSRSIEANAVDSLIGKLY